MAALPNSPNPMELRQVLDAYGKTSSVEMADLLGVDGASSSAPLDLEYFYGRGSVIKLRYANEIGANEQIIGTTTQSEFENPVANASDPNQSSITVRMAFSGSPNANYTGTANEPFVGYFTATGPANDPAYIAAVESSNGIKEIRIRHAVTGQPNSIIPTTDTGWKTSVTEITFTQPNAAGGEIATIQGPVYVDIKDNSNQVKTFTSNIQVTTTNIT